MYKVNIKVSDPVHYAQVTAEQEELKRIYSSSMTLARLCPYCGHKVEILCRGTHGGSYTRCPNSGENVFFPPVAFRIA